MTHSESESELIPFDQLSARSIRGIEFQTSKFGRGYDKRTVNSFLDEIATVVENLQQQLLACDREIERLEQRVIEGPRGDQVIQAVNVISNAQRTADSTVAEADAYSARVMSEARAAYDDARRRAAQLEQEAEENVRRLSASAQMKQGELDKQTAYLRTLRDATRTQMQKFLEGMLDHLTEEYGRAHPVAAEAAGSAKPVPGEEPDAGPTMDHDEEHSPADGTAVASTNGFVSAAAH
jgi:DivIVA domain-containing protein